MKEKILSIIYKKICEGFQTKFYTYSEFENEFSKHYSSLLADLTSLTQKYYQLKNSKNKDESSEVIKIHKEDYIIQSFNNEPQNYYSQTKYTIENIRELKESNEDLYNKYEQQYENYMSYENTDYSRNFLVPLMTFVETKAKEIVSSQASEHDFSIKKLFWDYFYNSLITWEWEKRIRIEELKETPELIIANFKEQYLLNIFLQLYKITENQISDIEFSGLESCIVNIGERKYTTERSGWVTNNFQVFNNGKTFAFTTSTKDESKVEGKFVNIFILQLNKRHLLKISITVNETEQTPYIIYRDFEKVSLKNECEILIAKHHGNETIIFDTKKEALEFQAKVLELKEGRSNNYKRN